jgi:signal peptidase I
MDRVFTTVSGDGQPQSYLQYFLIALAVFFVGEYFGKKEKIKKTSSKVSVMGCTYNF